MSFRFKEPGEKDEDDFTAGFKIPSVKQVLGGLDEAILRKEQLVKEHQEESEQQDKDKKKKPKQKRSGLICYCGAPGCGIGPMVETEKQG